MIRFRLGPLPVAHPDAEDPSGRGAPTRRRPVALGRALAVLLTLALSLAAPAGPVAALGRDEPVRLPDALLCRERIARIERVEGLPPGLLQAIALAESGRFDPERRQLLPWPWTVNAGGEAAYLASKQEAVRHVARLRAQGRTNIDVGCLQVNLGWHPEAFADLEAAFDPETNVAYAAAFLASLREEAGSWEQAVERYHSRDPDRGRSYRERVWRHWAALGGPATALADPGSAAGRPGRRPRAEPEAGPTLATTPVRDAAIERAALQAVNRVAARQTWRWLQLRLPVPAGPSPSPPAAVLAALDPRSAEPAPGAVIPSLLLGRPRLFAGPTGRAAAAPRPVPGAIAVRPPPGVEAEPARTRPRRPAAAS